MQLILKEHLKQQECVFRLTLFLITADNGTFYFSELKHQLSCLPFYAVITLKSFSIPGLDAGRLN